jgi:hypothetical protein
MTQEIADSEVGPEGIPFLIELLDEEDFLRPDNVIAFLAFLGYDSDAQSIRNYLDKSGNGSPDAYRARLLVPEALGRIASRGGDAAMDLLIRLRNEPAARADQGIRRMIERGMSLADKSIDLDSEDDQDLGDSTVDPFLFDPDPTIEFHDITYANHVDTNSKISDSQVDALLADVTTVFATENTGSDTACCVGLERTVPGTTFGVTGDGKDIITSSTEMNQVIALGIARIKVVDLITWCGGNGANIIGCGFTPGKGIVLVRIGGTANEGKLWSHEFGHNTGLGHNPTFGYIMYGSLSSANTKLTSSECFKYHNPSGAAQSVPSSLGVCHDDDGDLIASSGDNCPDDNNASQLDSDGDGVGDSCDNCNADSNPEQIDCDNDGAGDVCDEESVIPDEVNPILFNDKTTLSWPPDEFRKFIYRGFYNGGIWHYTHSQVATVNSGTIWEDTEVPDSGTMFYYLVTAFAACGEGP